MGKQFLVSAAIGALVVGLSFSIIGAVTYDPSDYQYTPRDVPHGWEDPGNSLFAGMDGFVYGAMIGAVLGGVAGAVTRAFSRRPKASPLEGNELADNEAQLALPE